MITLIVPILFLSIGWNLHDPVNLLSSTILFILVISNIVFKKNLNWHKSRVFILALSLPLVYIISAFVNSQSFESLFLGGYKRNYGLATFSALSLLFILSATSKSNLNNFLNYGLLSTLVLANIYGYVQYFGLDPLPWMSPTGAISLTLGNPNFAGALFGMITVVGFAKIISAKNKLHKMTYTLLFISSIFLGFQTKSLQSQVLLGLSSIVFILIYSFGQTSKLFRIIRYFSYCLTFFGIVGLTLVLSLDAFRELRDRIYFEGSILQRLDYWQIGINIWQDHLLFGVGADQFERFAALYRTPEQIARDGNMVIPDKAHNVLIDHLANGGFFAGLLWLVFLFSIYFALFRLVKLSGGQRMEVSILAGIWSAYVAQTLISPDQILLSVIGFISAGLIIRSYLNAQQQRIIINMHDKENPYLVRACAGFVLVISLVLFNRALGANADAKDLLVSKQVYTQSSIDGVASWPNPYIFELVGIELAKDLNNCKPLIEIANNLIKIDDRSSQGWYMKAVCANANREFMQALLYVNYSLKFDPLNPNYLIARAKLEIATKQLEKAFMTIAKIKRIKPSEPDIALLESYIATLKKQE